MENNVVSVMLWGEEVGKLYWDERSKRAVFNYHPDFIKKGIINSSSYLFRSRKLLTMD